MDGAERKIVKYKNDEVTVNWEPSKCQHSGVCINGLPSVFQHKEKPWIKIDGADAESIKKQVRACPSGALSLGE